MALDAILIEFQDLGAWSIAFVNHNVVGAALAPNSKQSLLILWIFRKADRIVSALHFLMIDFDDDITWLKACCSRGGIRINLSDERALNLVRDVILFAGLRCQVGYAHSI